LKGTAARHLAEGVVWLGIDSAAPGKQGYEPDDILDGVKRFGLTHPILLDETGLVGHAYGKARPSGGVVRLGLRFGTLEWDRASSASGSRRGARTCRRRVDTPPTPQTAC